MSLHRHAISTFCALLLVAIAGGCSTLLGFEDAKPFPDDPGKDASVDGSPMPNDVDARPDGADIGTGACGHDCTAVANIGSPADIKCSAGRCVLPSTACGDGYGDCDGNSDNGCETSLRNAEHCGACNKMCPSAAPLCATDGCVAGCPASTTQCGTSCVDIDVDPKHCGDCMTECSRPASGGAATCAQKMCGIQCLASFHTCPGTSDCASDTDAKRCGPMCVSCPAPANGDAACANGACSTTCRAGYRVCGASCVDTSNDVKNCGGCGHDCAALPHIGSTTGVSCSAGVCVVPATACSTGFGHCTANADDGCETDITTPAHCQGCTAQCPADMPVCTATGCKSQCPPATPTQCTGTCVDLNSDAMHCGTCTTGCMQPTSGGSATCEQKACVLHCLTGFHACGTMQCASDNDAARCEGLSCHACVAPANGAAQCVANKCVPSCNAGFHLCNGACVADSDPLNCGGSCTVCPGPTTGTGSAVCSAGTCALSCPQGHVCGTGCYSNTDATHCGDPACAMCPAPSAGTGTAQCSSGACTITCSNGTNCSGACYDLNTNAAHCGNCTNSCGAGQVCLSGMCAVDCGSKTRCGTACIDTSTDPDHCGACNNAVCPNPGPNGTRRCVAGQCSPTCNNGVPLCSGQCPNFQSDAQNCGSCGMACTGGRVCTSALCCMPNQINANGICCAQGQINASGICCNSGEFNSNGLCCPTGQFNSNGTCCASNRINCGGGVCRDLTGDVNNCNTCGHACPALPNTNASCSSSACVYACKTGHPLSCTPNTNPSCASWDFESGGLEGWVTADGVQVPFRNATVAPHPGGTGGRSLGIDFNIASGVGGAHFKIKVPLCGGSQFNIGGKHFHYWTMGASKPGSGSFGGDPSVDNCSTTNPNAYDGQNFVYNPNDDTCMGFGDGVWKEVTGSMVLANDPGATVTDVGIVIALNFPGPWQGSVYIDDFEIVP